MATKKIVETPKQEHPQKAITNILMRILAVFAASGLSVVGAGSLFGIEVWKSIALAGGLGVATVVEALSRAYLADGKLTTSEINEAFSLVDKRKSAE
jgi:preprotein translocase subunit SecF